MSKKVAEIAPMFMQENTAAWVSNLWDKYNQQRQSKLDEWTELRDYVFATDTSTTSNSTLPWKNSTTIPKICQIRDNLHSNYLSALFPNDRWLKWSAYSEKDATKKKAETIEAYMENKTREIRFRSEMSRLLYDYIDYGNVFATVSFEAQYKELANGTQVPIYIGPTVSRISPYDIVFNPLARSFDDSFKVVRSIKTVGELKLLAESDPDQEFWMDVVGRRAEARKHLGGWRAEDFNKAIGYSADGFGNMYEYYGSDYVEILEFYGDYHDSSTDELKTRKVLTVVDRSTVVREEDIPNWFGSAPIFHVGWRHRPDNLWSMGPLDNLVGMQYRLDHLENLKADAMDLAVYPPLAVIGEVEEFVWGPGVEIHIGEGGSVQEIAKNLNSILGTNQEILYLMDLMELMAGAPREAMGIRTPGEKTATEVMELQNAAGRIFQEKITSFEINLLEPTLNSMLEVAARHMPNLDVIRIIDDDFGVQEFKSITREDITANGILRPIGARHFAKQAQDLQNVIGIMGSPLGQMIAPHTSGENMTKFISDVTNLKNYNIFRPNVAIEEQRKTQALAQQAQAEMEEQQGSVQGGGI